MAILTEELRLAGLIDSSVTMSTDFNCGGIHSPPHRLIKRIRERKLHIFNFNGS